MTTAYGEHVNIQKKYRVDTQIDRSRVDRRETKLKEEQTFSCKMCRP